MTQYTYELQFKNATTRKYPWACWKSNQRTLKSARKLRARVQKIYPRAEFRIVRHATTTRVIE